MARRRAKPTRAVIVLTDEPDGGCSVEAYFTPAPKSRKPETMAQRVGASLYARALGHDLTVPDDEAH